MIKTQKVMSSVFPAGECNLRISVYQSSVNGVEYLSMCLESKDIEKSKPGFNHMHRDTYGRFDADNKTGDNTSLGWNDYMKKRNFIRAESGYLVDDMAVFSMSFHVIKEHNTFSKNPRNIVGKNRIGNKKFDGHFGKFSWKIENFTRLKDLLKKEKITGLCIKSRKFQIGNRDCRHIVYPRETSVVQDFSHQDSESGNALLSSERVGKRSSFMWKVENFLSFKKIMKTQKIFSKFFQAGGDELGLVLTSENDQNALTTDPDELIDLENSEGTSGDEEDIFRNLLSRAGFHLTCGDSPSQP
ncbi:hypothetical protein ACH5RR_040072 [Cinchona calisaya]|uniref:MATH domain-containing protein n=1 Tax=Cinchona calisaya TaxID=153742 RepID=A0ABD2XTZ9_9GENT